LVRPYYIKKPVFFGNGNDYDPTNNKKKEQVNLLLRCVEYYMEHLLEEIQKAGAQEVPQLLLDRYQLCEELVSGLKFHADNFVQNEDKQENETATPT
jgi:hypothetical protein